MVVNLLELIQVMQKNGYDLDYGAGNIQTLMSSKIKTKKTRKKINKRKGN